MLLRSLEIFSSALFGLDVLVFAIGSCETISQTSKEIKVQISRLKLLTVFGPRRIGFNSMTSVWVVINFKRRQAQDSRDQYLRKWEISNTLV